MTAMPATEKPTRDAMFGDLRRWQSILGHNRDVFADMQTGARISLLPWDDAAALTGTMMIWEFGAGGMETRLQPFNGYDATQTDLILVFNDDALVTLYENITADALATIKTFIRDGDVLFYVMKTGKELRQLGYETFLDSLGLAYVGACR